MIGPVIVEVAVDDAELDGVFLISPAALFAFGRFDPDGFFAKCDVRDRSRNRSARNAGERSVDAKHPFDTFDSFLLGCGKFRSEIDPVRFAVGLIEDEIVAYAW